MKKALVSVVIAAAFYAAAASAYTLESETKTVSNGIARIETTVRVGLPYLEKFTMTRVVKVNAQGNPLPIGQLEGAIILLPGGDHDFSMYDLEPGGRSLAEYLAARNVDVYGYSPRSDGMTLGACLIWDCSVMGGWGMDTYLSDIDIIRTIVTLRWLGQRPAVGGLSLGAILTEATLNEHPLLYKGAVIWEGLLYYSDPEIQSAFTEKCADLTSRVAGGEYYDSLTPLMMKMVWNLYLTNPDGESPFAPGMTNYEFYIYFATTPMDPPDAEAPGYIYFMGDVESGLYYADEALMDPFVAELNAYDPLAIQRDYVCGFAGATTWTDNLSAYRGPILAMKNGHGFGPYMDQTLDLFTHESRLDVVSQPDFGHADGMVNYDYNTVIADVIYDWLMAYVF